MLVVLARVGGLGALLAQDAELLRGEDGAPFVVGLVDRVRGHVGGGGGVLGGGAAEGAEEGAEGGDAGHGRGGPGGGRVQAEG